MSEEPKAKTPPVYKVILVFLRVTETIKGKKANLFYLITPEEWTLAEDGFPPKLEDREKERCFSQAVGKNSKPGQVLEFAAENAEGTSVFQKREKYMGMWPDETARLGWTTTHATWKTIWASKARKKKDGEDDPLKKRLHPLREEYKRTVGMARRAALLATIISIITG